MLAYDVGDKVQWPNTQMPAQEGQRSLTVLDTDVIRHRSGRYYIRYLYDGLHERMIEDMRTNVENDFDNLVTIIGPEGVGKSSDAYYICKTYDPDFDPLKSCVYSWEQFITSVSEDPQKVYWFDEAVLAASGRDWMKESNKMLVKALQIIRSMNLTFIMCVPVFGTIDVYIRLFRTRYLISVQKMKWSKDREYVRGYAELMIPKSEAERSKLPKDARPEDYFKSVGFFKFPKIDGPDKEIYDRLKQKGQKDAFEDMKNLAQEASGKSKYQRDKKSLAALISYCVDSKGMTYQEVADVSGMPYNTVKTIAWRKRNEGENNERRLFCRRGDHFHRGGPVCASLRLSRLRWSRIQRR